MKNKLLTMIIELSIVIITILIVDSLMGMATCGVIWISGSGK